MARGIGVTKYKRKVRHKRPGIHSKCKQSKNKTSKNYFKQYVGQGH